MSRDKRKQIIQDIEKKRDSKVITYITSDRANLQVMISHDVVSIIHDHILMLKEEARAKLDLFIYSRGGASDVPWTLVSMFREYCHEGSFSVLIPYRAHSAATVISLGADEILMTKKAELGPIDATMTTGPYNPTEGDTRNRLPVSVEDVTGYFSLLDRFGCERADEKMKGFEQLTNKVHPLALGAVSRLLEETKLVGLRLLNTRAKPFSEEENHEIIRKLSSEVYSHSHTINRTEAIKYLGLKQVRNAEDATLENDLWSLYLEYRDMFQLENPFNPEEHLVANNLEENTWDNLNLACIESADRLDVCRKSIRVKRLRQVPPTINLNLTNIQFPVINLPNLQPNMNPQQIQALVQQMANATMQQILNTAVQNAINELMKSLPQIGFEHVSLNSGWVKEA
ncbi:hypothetical protein CLG94_09290 [Candidatus Methylomirabilis limnetica]|uniref:Serine protease n=1 Tax=Candidatus Methylomirabilis limnetica TaxID=2033718 RepID=A0A2T4TWH3_9BACT|nr:hypothetical protein [Candidatus Methylomirabilis limnetica]PTL35456.1 hypothetical protein CLG94_09290 [Candidatus Methylomirabilis limnetica]